MSDACAGKNGRCPNCKRAIVVPTAQAPDATEGHAPPEDATFDTDFLEWTRKDNDEAAQRYAQELATRPARESPEPVDGPARPWPLGAFLYPLNPAGIVHLIALWFLLFVLCPSIMMSVGLGLEFIPIVYTLPIAYAVYYLSECIRDSLGGSRGAPAFWMHPTDSSKWDCISQTFLVLGSVAVCFYPVALCRGLRGQFDWISALLAATGGFFFPMLLLAVMWFDSFSGLSLRLILQSIGRTFLPYCALVLIWFGLAVLFVGQGIERFWVQIPPLSVLACRLLQFYLVFVAAAVLGGFHHRYGDRFDWQP